MMLSPMMQAYLQRGLEQAAKPSQPLKSDSWLQALACLDATSEEALSEFLATTYTSDIELIPVGVHNEIPYFIRTSHVNIPQRSSISLKPLKRMRGVSDYVKSFDFTLPPGGGGPRPDFRYGFALGRLVYRRDKNSATSDAGFFVVFNVLDKSVWIAVDMEPFVNADIEFRTEPLPSTWGLLPKDDERKIGTMRISQSKWWKKNPPVLVNSDPFVTYPSYYWQLVRAVRTTDVATSD
eukprot:TRINITY_DN4706_c0_g1_i1.p1 TRINITY_DN4706_c0_g1~~TRINITY_DN4706_c0_g1_i1.p1  ORF type:complete len:237 (+),score=2.54 TRINITY_DN4706_c0_g1_i1:79-789(+)